MTSQEELEELVDFQKEELADPTSYIPWPVAPTLLTSGKGRRLSMAAADWIVQCHERGINNRTIAAYSGISQATISRVINSYVN